jgi:hypothetical protein
LQSGLAMARGTVVVHAARPPHFWRCHEGITLCGVAASIARFKGFDYGGHWDGPRPGCLFFVPDETLLRPHAEGLGILGSDDLFGGIVPHAFVQTKIITHPLVTATAERPDGWSDAFTRRSRQGVLPGYSAFGRRDAAEAVGRLLAIGPVRAKLPRAAGAREQYTLESRRDLDALIGRVSDTELAEHGVVFETNLEPATTFSIGLVTLDDLTIAYHGRQWLGRDNAGRSVYGGSALTCVRGGWDALERLDVEPAVGLAIRQARIYDGATEEYGIIASRRNYDVGQGIDARGHRRSGVFEASWRLGGASPAELAAVHLFAESPSLEVVQASTVEAYGRNAEPPPGAIVHFHGEDEQDGPMTRYTVATPALERVA